LVISWDPLGSTPYNPNTFTNTNVRDTGLIGPSNVLGLLPNILGGTVSPTFYTTQYGNLSYWNGSVWVITNLSFGFDLERGITGCNNALFLLSGNIPGPFQVKKLTPPSTISTILSGTMTVARSIASDCNCNFYLLGQTALYKYDPFGSLIATYNFVGTPFWVTTTTRFTVIGDKVYVINGGTNSTAISRGIGTISGNSVITGSLNSNYSLGGLGIISCPAPMPLNAVINSATLGCNPNTVSLAVTCTPSPLNLTWSGPGIITPVSASVVNVNAAGSYSCKVQEGFCSDTLGTLVTTVVSNTSVVQPSIAPGNNLCFESNLFLSSSINSSQYTYSWTGSNIAGTSSTSVIQVQGPGTYSLKVMQSNNGCVGSATSSVLSTPILNFSISTPTLCVYSIEGDNIAILSYSGATLYTLMVSQGFSLNLSPSQPVALYQTMPFASNGSAGSATIIGSNGPCTASAVTNFSVLPVSIIHAAPKDTTVCLNKKINLYASGAKSYSWLSFEDNLIIVNDSNVVADIRGNSNFTVTGIDNHGCRTTPVVLSAKVFPQHSGFLNYKPTLCAPACIDIKFEPLLSNIGTTCNWTVNNQFFSSTKSFKPCFATSGEYKVFGDITDSVNHCRNSVSFALNLNPKPKADFIFSPIDPVEGVDKVFFTNTSSGEALKKFSWFFTKNNGYSSNLKDESFTYMEAGQYKVAMVVANQWQCADTIIKIVQVQPDFGLYIPNAFTPNGDDRNDIFIPVVGSVKLYELKIFDRWGKEIFHTNDQSIGWDGNYRGVECQEGVYTWKIELAISNGKQLKKAGHVTLIK